MSDDIYSDSRQAGMTTFSWNDDFWVFVDFYQD